METKRNSRWLFLFLAFSLLLPSFVFAGEEAPAAIGKFIEFAIDLVSGKIGILIIMLIIVLSAVLAWKNATYTPVIYGLIAATLIGGAASIGVSFADFNLTGYGD